MLKNLSSILLFRFNQFYGSYRGFTATEAVTDDMRRRFYYPKSDYNPSEERDDNSIFIDYKERSKELN